MNNKYLRKKKIKYFQEFSSLKKKVLAQFFDLLIMVMLHGQQTASLCCNMSPMLICIHVSAHHLYLHMLKTEQFLKFIVTDGMFLGCGPQKEKDFRECYCFYTVPLSSLTAQ